MNISSDFSKLIDLEKMIEVRGRTLDSKSSYTASLVNGGIAYACKKMGEEAIETMIAALEKDKKSLIYESADLIYHMMVVWHIADVKLADVLATLDKIWCGDGEDEDTRAYYKKIKMCKNNSSEVSLFLNCRKMGEESIATIIVALEKNKKFLVDKSAVLICFLFLIWKIVGVLFEKILIELTRRMTLSGLQEKANRYYNG